MEAKEKEILNELISGTKCQFVIPVFQRNYDWRIKDCDRLFKDIVELAQDKEHPDRKHFIGAFVCKFNKFVDTAFNQFVLIDGQQRLTSITLILKALYDYLGEFGEKYEETRSEIKETYLINKFAKDSNLRLKLKPNQVDNENFNRLMEDKKTDVESNIGRNYLEFRKMISKMPVSIEDFYNAIQRLEGVVVYLDDSDNPQVIFESLNSTGLELTDVDLMRNYLLMNCNADLQTRLYKEYWLQIENILGNNFLPFIKDFLSLKNGVVTSSAKNYVYQAFQKYYNFGHYDKEQFLQSLLEYAKIYNRLYDLPTDNKELSVALRDYCELDIKTSYPFVFGLLIDNTPNAQGVKKIDDNTLAKILRLLESYLIRRNVCNLAGGGLSQIMASLYNDLQKKHGDKLYTDIFNKISSVLASISTKAYFPKDDEFIREFKTRDMYHNRNVAYILRKLETQKQGKEIIDFDKLTIEHIMPQTLSNEWVKYLDNPNWEIFHNEYVHKVGNLSLTAYNTEMSNKLYEEKKAHIDFSRLTLNKYFENIDSWKDEDVINDRAEHLAKMALAIWPYPQVTDIDDIATASHFLLDDEPYEYTGTNPAGIQIRNENIISASWTELFIDTIKYLYKLNEDLLISLLNKKAGNGEKPIISIVSEELRVPQKITDTHYIETNYNTEKKVKILTELFVELQFEPDEIIIFIK